MPSTTNFGWTTPADTDLVKDGASAIRTLGNGIDTSFLDLKGGTTGQSLRKATNTDLDFTWAGDATNTVIDAEGDLLVGDSADTLQRLAIGTTGQVLTVDTTVDGKLKWASAGASFSGCRVTKSTNQTINSSTNTILTFDTETFDTNGYHSTTTNTGRMTAPTAGYYSYQSQICWNLAGDIDNNTLSRIKKNGSSIQEIYTPGALNRYITQVLVGVVYMAANDYLELEVYNGTAANLTIASSNALTNFSITSLGA